jgi:8-oxo-dGTP diphosphatase
VAPSSTSTIQAAGAVLWRSAREPYGPVEVALIHRPHRNDWTFPKGKLEPGEDATTAAVREVEEETGYHVRLGRPLPRMAYDVDGVPKQVRYWLAEARGDQRGPWEPGAEVDAVEWLSWDDAAHRLTYDHDRTLLVAADASPLRTVPLVVVRHAKAVKRGAWDRDDRLRPLDARGAAQARRLVPVLAAYGVTAVHSSDAARCRDTVEPYASSLGTDLVEEPGLSEEGHRDDPNSVGKRAADLLAEPAAVVVCSHRPVLPDLFAVLLAGAPREARRAVDRPLSPAGIVVLHRDLQDPAAPRVVAVERLRV